MAHQGRRPRGVYVFQRGSVWAYRVELPPDQLTNRRRRLYRGGFEDENTAWAEAIKAKDRANDSRPRPPQKATVEQFFREWIESIEHEAKPSTITNYNDYLDAYVLPILGDRKLTEITVQTLNALYRHLLEQGRRKADGNSRMYAYWLAGTTAGQSPGPTEIARACGTSIYAAKKAASRYRRGRVPAALATGLSVKTVRNIHFMLHLALKDAVAWGYTAANPAVHAAVPRQRRNSKPRPKPWTADELARWLQLALKDRFAALWMLVATTGMRRSELAGLRRENLMLDRNLVVTGKDTRIVVGGKATDSDGKSQASGRVISIDDVTANLLQEYVAMLDAERQELGDAYMDDNRLFCYANGKAPHPDTITAMFNRLVDLADAPRIRLHDVRHTYATLSLDHGIDLKIVSDRLGHANVYVTAQIYGHPSTGRDRSAAEKMASIIRGKDNT